MTFKAPVPKSNLTCSSNITGIALLINGIKTFTELGLDFISLIKLEYLSSSGLIATAVSPNIVSGLVVATINS